MKIKIDCAENGDVLIDETKAPFDGKPVLIKTTLGWAEAWWMKGETLDYPEGTEYDGFMWVVLDDITTAMFDEVSEWVQLPKEQPNE